MSRSLNKVTLIGNLGADPEVRSTTGGGRVASAAEGIALVGEFTLQTPTPIDPLGAPA